MTTKTKTKKKVEDKNKLTYREKNLIQIGLSLLNDKISEQRHFLEVEGKKSSKKLASYNQEIISLMFKIARLDKPPFHYKVPSKKK